MAYLTTKVRSWLDRFRMRYAGALSTIIAATVLARLTDWGFTDVDALWVQTGITAVVGVALVRVETLLVALAAQAERWRWVLWLVAAVRLGAPTPDYQADDYQPLHARR